MKKLKILAIAAVALLAASCAQEALDALTMVSTEIKVSDVGVQQDLKFVTNADWTLECEAEWITFDQTSGQAGEISVKMTVQPNETYEQREAIVLIKAGDKETQFKIVQDFLKEFTTETEYVLDNNAQFITYTLTYNVEFEVIIEDGVDWITYVPAVKGAPVTDEIKFEIAESTVDDRSGYVIIKAGKYAHKLVIKQSSFVDMARVEASFIGTRMLVYDKTEYTYIDFDEYYLKFTNDSNDAMTLALNCAMSETPLAGIPEGDYLVDATGKHGPQTFSLAAPDGSIEFYTSVTASGKKITVVDGMVSVAKEDGIYTILALLFDESENSYSYRYRGAIDPIVDDSFGADLDIDFRGKYDTYFSTQANKWSFTFYIAGNPSPEYPRISYLSFSIYGATGEVNMDDITEGVYTLTVPGNVPDLTYANGILDAKTGDLTNIGGNTRDFISIRAKEGVPGTVTISKTTDGTYEFDFDLTIEAYTMDWSTYTATVQHEIPFKHKIKKIRIGQLKQGLDAMPDGDAEFNRIMNSQYNGLFWGDPWETGGGVSTIGLEYVNDFFTIYLTLNQSDAYVYEKNFQGRFCNTPLQEGEYVFSKTPTAGQLSLVPARYGKANAPYSYVKNSYTGSTMPISGGSITLTNTNITYNIQATIGEQVYNFTGTHAASLGLLQDWTKRAKNLKIAE